MSANVPVYVLRVKTVTDIVEVSAATKYDARLQVKDMPDTFDVIDYDYDLEELKQRNLIS